jgi:eukaryotic-like serine/threonine-protein kinase
VIGTQISGYHVDAKLGEGAMGEVFVATNQLLGKRVAIKVLRLEHSQNADVVNRFFREARATAMLNHPGCVDVIDSGRLPDGRGFIIMALLEGESLRDRLARERLRPAVQIAIARQLADTLSVAHDKGIIHRDLKPDNVFLVSDASDPSGVRVKVLDFGVAKLSQDAGPNMMTSPHAIIGTPAYMSPEQYQGATLADAQSDIYSLGCVMFEMACGRTPFVGRVFGDYLLAHLTAPVPAPSSLANVPPALERVIVRALSKSKQDRQRSMAELVTELDGLVELKATVVHDTDSVRAMMGLPSLRPAPATAAAPTRARGRLGLRLAVLGLALAAAAGASWWLLQ